MYGQVAFEAYFKACGGKSLISGQPLPAWADQADDIKQAWEAAASAVLLSYADEEDDGEYPEEDDE